MAPTLANLPPELVFMIASYLDPHSLHSLVQSSRNLHSLLNSTLWSLMDHSTTLVWAASYCSWPLVEYTLSHGADPGAKDMHWFTALHYAAMHGHEPTVTALLDAGAEMDVHAKDFNTPIGLAAKGGFINIATLLLDRGASVSGTLAGTCEEGYLEMAELLLERGANVDGDCCHLISRENHLYLQTPIAGAYYLCPQIPIAGAVRAGHKEIVKLLYTWGANLEKKDSYGLVVKDLVAIHGIDLGDAGKRKWKGKGKGKGKEKGRK